MPTKAGKKKKKSESQEKNPKYFLNGFEKKNGHMCRNFTYGFVKPNFDASVLAFCRYVGIFTT